MEVGFSLNEKLLEAKMKEQCLVAERIAYEEISKEGGILKADIRKKMISSVKQSHRFPKQLTQSRYRKKQGALD